MKKIYCLKSYPLVSLTKKPTRRSTVRLLHHRCAARRIFFPYRAFQRDFLLFIFRFGLHQFGLGLALAFLEVAHALFRNGEYDIRIRGSEIAPAHFVDPDVAATSIEHDISFRDPNVFSIKRFDKANMAILWHEGVALHAECGARRRRAAQFKLVAMRRDDLERVRLSVAARARIP